MPRKHLFQRRGQFVVIGKGVPRSVGLSSRKSASRYAAYYREKGKKPRIMRIK